MPRTDTEVELLLSNLQAARNSMDASADQSANDDAKLSETLLTEAAGEEGKISSLRRQSNARDAKDRSGREADTLAIKTLTANSSMKIRQAEKLRRDAQRKLSLKHDKEVLKGEICIHCVAKIDDSGEIIGATHYRMPIEDVPGVNDRGEAVNLKGLRSLLRDDEADLDPADGRLRINGRRIGKD